MSVHGAKPALPALQAKIGALAESSPWLIEALMIAGGIVLLLVAFIPGRAGADGRDDPAGN